LEKKFLKFLSGLCSNFFRKISEGHFLVFFLQNIFLGVGNFLKNWRALMPYSENNKGNVPDPELLQKIATSIENITR
jgi:hypothetical protein